MAQRCAGAGTMRGSPTSPPDPIRHRPIATSPLQEQAIRRSDTLERCLPSPYALTQASPCPFRQLLKSSSPSASSYPSRLFQWTQNGAGPSPVADRTAGSGTPRGKERASGARCDGEESIRGGVAVDGREQDREGGRCQSRARGHGHLVIALYLTRLHPPIG